MEEPFQMRKKKEEIETIKQMQRSWADLLPHSNIQLHSTSHLGWKTCWKDQNFLQQVLKRRCNAWWSIATVWNAGSIVVIQRSIPWARWWEGLWPLPIWLRLLWHGFHPSAKLSRSLLPKMGCCCPYWLPICYLWMLGGGISAYRPAAQGRRKAWPPTWSIPTLGFFTLVLAFVNHHLPDTEHRCIKFTPLWFRAFLSGSESCSCLPDPF